jgi:hypothetical protein
LIHNAARTPTDIDCYFAVLVICGWMCWDRRQQVSKTLDMLDQRTRRLAPHIRVVLYLAATLVASGCRQIVGFDAAPSARDSGTGTGDHGQDAASRIATTTACDLPYATSECASCIASSCCAESSACAHDFECKMEQTCLNKCGPEPQCRARCGVDGPVSLSAAASDLTACLASQCEHACELECGLGVTDYGSCRPEFAEPCRRCTVMNFCDEAATCMKSADCDARQRCLSTCRTPECRQTCDREHATSRELQLALVTAARTCVSDCGYDRNWNCVGHVHNPGPKSDTLTLSVELRSFLDRSLFNAVHVAVCDPLDFDCAQPRAQGMAQENGRTTVSFSNPYFPATGFTGYLQLNSPASGLVLAFSGFPVLGPLFEYVDMEDGDDISVYTLTLQDGREFADSVGVSLDASRGVVIAHVSNCIATTIAPDVEVTLEPTDPGVSVRYGTNPNLTATDNSGIVTFFNVPPGTVTLTATPRSLGVPSSQQRAIVRAGAVTSVGMPPTP